MPVSGVVPPSFPLCSVLSGEDLVKTFHACPLDNRRSWSTDRRRGGGLTETHVVHLANDLEARIRVERKPRLMKKTVRPRSPRLASGVEPNASLANPDEEASNSCGERYSRMGDASARLQHQTRDPSHRNVRAHTVSVDHDERTVQDIELSLLDEQNGGAIFDRDGVGRSDPRNRRPQ